MTPALPTTWVIPCYNEAQRLAEAPLRALLDASPDAHLLLVDDGSTDATAALLSRYVAALGPRAAALSLPRNGGKAEAVRQGLTAALAAGAARVGYLDADFSTPPDEAARLAAALDAPGCQVVLGSRVRRLGAEVERSPVRHALGRLFATVASVALDLPVYDTQCGAKLFLATPALAAALARPFSSRWAFDVELLGRLLDAGVPAAAFTEVPLARWVDVGGSKLRAGAMAKAGLDLVEVAWRRRVGRR